MWVQLMMGRPEAPAIKASRIAQQLDYALSNRPAPPPLGAMIETQRQCARLEQIAVPSYHAGPFTTQARSSSADCVESVCPIQPKCKVRIEAIAPTYVAGQPAATARLTNPV